MDVKTTFIFAQGKQGWTETYYSQPDDMTTAMDDAKSLAQDRALMLNKQAYIEAIRVSDEAVVGDSGIEVNGLISLTNSKIDGDTCWNSWLIRVEATTKYRRQLWISGMPDEWIKINTDKATFPINAAFEQAFASFAGKLKVKKYCIRALSKADADTLPAKISEYAQAANPKYTTVTANAHGKVKGEEIRIRGGKGEEVKQFRGIWTIFNVTANTFDIPVKARSWADVVYKPETAKVLSRVPKYFLITDAKPMRAAKKSRGKAFFVPAGAVHKK